MKARLEKIFFSYNSLVLIVFLSSFLNAILRIEPSSPLTFFRFIAPFLTCYLLFIKKRSTTPLLLFLGLLTYSTIAISISGYNYWVSTYYTLNYLYLIFLYMTFDELKIIWGQHFNFNLLRVFRFTLYFIYALFILKKYFSIVLYINYDSYYYNNTIFSTPNDLALAISALLIIILTAPEIRYYEKIFHTMAVIAINYQNDSRSAFLSNIITLGALFFFYFVKKMSQINFKIKTAILVFISTMAIVGIISLKDVDIPFVDNNLNFSEHIFEPIRRIAQLEPYRLAGSIYDRTDTAIFALTEFYKSLGFGLGTSGSILLLEKTYYKTASAKSVHNFLLEWLVDFGWLTVFLFLFVLILYFKQLANISKVRNLALLTFLPPLPLLCATQSSGYISNFMFWAAVFYIFHLALKEDYSQKATS